MPKKLASGCAIKNPTADGIIRVSGDYRLVNVPGLRRNIATTNIELNDSEETTYSAA
jgi:hypothetical protein